MDIQFLPVFLGWCLVFNFGILLLWAFMFKFARNWVFRVHTSFGFKHLSEESFDEIHYLSMAIFKLLVFMFNFVPYLVLRIAF